MSRPRLIPCLLLKNGMLVRSQLFKVHQAIGNPISTILRFSNWNVDELIILDIGEEDRQDLRRNDLQVTYRGSSVIDLLKQIAPVCQMPLTVGGRIRSLDDFYHRLTSGADKCAINTAALENPDFISQAAQKFGSQCVVVSIDVKQNDRGDYEVFSSAGHQATGRDPCEWAKEVEKLGAGEIFLNSIDRDGSAKGYDCELIQQVVSNTKLPVIACGGVGSYEDFPEGITKGGAHSVSAANIFHFFELSYPHAKRLCLDTGLNMREVNLKSIFFPREPQYESIAEEDRCRTQSRLSDYKKENHQPMQWCRKCVYPYLSAAPMEFDDASICMGCHMAEIKGQIDSKEWDRRQQLIIEIFESYKERKQGPYDCVIPVSGGKDSYFQTHVMKEMFGLNPLLVTYSGNNWTKVGWRNMTRMGHVFGVDHIVVSPPVEVLIKLNRLGLSLMGDMNWHAHVGITTAPVRVAVENQIPLVIWGEHGYLDLCGQFSLDDFPEMSYRDRLEHFARGYEWTYMVGREGLTEDDLTPWQYPSDDDLFELDLRGLYLGNYVYWEANEHLKLVKEKYGFEVSDEPFERTYRTMSNLDDMHENGIHDYLKYIKFGYGRCTDHVCKDIRAGLLSREEGVERVRQMDPIKSRDLHRWLKYVGMSENEFDQMADTFRDPRVWWKEDGQWKKENIWDE